MFAIRIEGHREGSDLRLKRISVAPSVTAPVRARWLHGEVVAVHGAC